MDVQILEFFESIQHPILNFIFRAITYAGDKGIVWIFLIMVLFIVGRRKMSITTGISLIYMQIISNGIIKNLVARPRPFITHGFTLLIQRPSGFSFPSGHTSSSFACATAIFYYDKTLGTGAYILAILMAISRMYFTVHYPSDILAGIVVGVMCGLLGILTMKAIKSMEKESHLK